MGKRKFFAYDTDRTGNMDEVRTLSEIRPEDLPEGVGGGKTVLYVEYCSNGGYLYKDIDLTEKVTKEELLSLKMNFSISDCDNYHVKPFAVAGYADIDYADAYAIWTNSPTFEAAQIVHFQTAEYNGR